MQHAHSPPLERSGWTALAGASAIGLLGAVPRQGGGVDPLALLAWLALVAPAAGAWCGARGVRLLPLGLLVPGLWMLLFVEVDLMAERDLAGALGPGLVFSGLYLAGLGIGALFPASPARTAGLLLLAATLLACLGVAGGVVSGEGGLAAVHPRLQAALLELSPLTPTFDAAGWDWAHANPAVYRLGGVEWAPRSPWNGRLAGAVFSVVGCALAVLFPLFRRA